MNARIKRQNRLNNKRVKENERRRAELSKQPLREVGLIMPLVAKDGTVINKLPLLALLHASVKRG